MAAMPERSSRPTLGCAGERHREIVVIHEFLLRRQSVRINRVVPQDDIATESGHPECIAVSEFQVGYVLAGRYRLVARLGKGGGGTVWRVSDKKVGEEVALKIVDNRSQIERWRREVALARRVSHTNVCRVYDLGVTDNGIRYVTMELVAGTTLRALLSDKGISAETRMDIAQQLVRGVAAIHEAGIIHRDIKPSNIVVEATGRVVIVDFGLARGPSTSGTEPTSHTGSGAVLGTPGYMAPEQAAGQSVDMRTDVYSLGLVLREIISRHGSVTAQKDTTPARPGNVQVTVTPETPDSKMTDTIAGCLHFEPEDRFASGTQVQLHLEQAKSRATAKHKLPWLILGGLVVAALAAAGIVLVASNDSEQAAKKQPIATSPDTPLPAALTMRSLAIGSPDKGPESVALSPNGQRVAYSMGDEVFVRQVDGSEAKPIPMPTSSTGFQAIRRASVLGFASDTEVVVRTLDYKGRWQVWTLSESTEPVLLVESRTYLEAALAPDGISLALARGDIGVFLLNIATKVEHRVFELHPGARIDSITWSPDSQRLALIHRGTRPLADFVETVSINREIRRTTIAAYSTRNLRPQLLAWNTSEKLGVFLSNGNSTSLVELNPTNSGQKPRRIHQWKDQHIRAAAIRGDSFVVLGHAYRPEVLVSDVRLSGSISTPKIAHSSSNSAKNLVGWLDDKKLVYSTSRGSTDDLVSATLDGETEILHHGEQNTYATAIADAAILFKVPHASDGESEGELWSVTPDRNPRHLTDLTTPSHSPVRCAGEQTAPCVIEDIVNGTLQYSGFDPETGKRGTLLYQAGVAARTERDFALSSDGKSLALVDGSDTVVRVSVEDGGVTRQKVKSARLHAITWAHNDTSIIVSGTDYGRDRYALLRLLVNQTPKRLRGSMTHWMGRAHESPNGTVVAIQSFERSTELWLVDGWL